MAIAVAVVAMAFGVYACQNDNTKKIVVIFSQHSGLHCYKDAEGVTKLVDHTFDVLRNTNNCWRMQIGVKYIFN